MDPEVKVPTFGLIYNTLVKQKKQNNFANAFISKGKAHIDGL